MLPIPTTNKLLSALPLADRQRISSYLTDSCRSPFPAWADTKISSTEPTYPAA